MVYDKTSYSPE